MENRRSFFDFKVVIGLLILIYGLLILLRNMGYIHGVRFWEFWPVILIFLGLHLLFKPQVRRQYFSGGLLTILGALFLLNNLEIIDLRWRLIWPILIILLGVVIIYHSIWRKKNQASGKDILDLSMVFGGGDYKFDSKSLHGGSISAVMGGGTINLRNAEMAESEMVLDIHVIMGGIELIIPDHWAAIVGVTPVLGGVDNKSLASQTGEKPGKRLIVNGAAIMGGIEIRN
jgi:predicted membrane protein